MKVATIGPRFRMQSESLWWTVFLSFILVSGCSGRNVLRHNDAAQALPHPLFVRVEGKGSPIIFLHGIASSHRYWDGLIQKLDKNHKIVAPDLLGFGRSPWPDIGYTVADHIAALSSTIEQVIGSEKAIVVGHSMGAILALNYALAHPERVDRLILLSPPYVSSREDLRKKLSGASMFESVMAMNSIVAPLACWLHESLGTNSIVLFRPFIRDLPDAVVEDAVLHTWRSYNGSLEHVIIQQPLGELLEKMIRPVAIVVAKLDKTADPTGLKGVGKTLGIPVIVVEGEHNFLVQSGASATEFVRHLIGDNALPKIPSRTRSN